MRLVAGTGTHGRIALHSLFTRTAGVAGVAEQADAPGLGPGPHWGWRFESSRPHKRAIALVDPQLRHPTDYSDYSGTRHT